MEHRFFVPVKGDRTCVLDGLENVAEDWQLLQGVSRASDWPRDACFRMDEEFPEDLQLADALLNGNSVPVISWEFKEWLQSQSLRGIEYLPVLLINHKGKAVKQRYFILNPVGLQECIDIERTRWKPDPFGEDFLDVTGNLTLVPEMIDPSFEAFRVSRFPEVLILSARLAEGMQAQGFTGFRTGPLNEYNPLGF